MTVRSILLIALALVLSRGPGGLLPAAAEGAPQDATHRQRVDLEGIAVDFEIEPLDETGSPSLREGQLVLFRFGISDSASGTPLSGVFPAAWMDRLPFTEITDERKCLDKVEMFLGGSLLSRAELDLNVYYVLTMNEDATLSVVDPLFGFGGTKLLSMVQLWSPARDWILTPDRRRIFISMPEVDAIAVVETHNWQVLTNIPTAPSPGRMVVQPDGVYLWVGFDEAEPGEPGSGVAVLQPANLAERTRIVTGNGHHEIAVSSDNRYAYVTNAEDGTLSVIDIRELAVVATVKTGQRPTSIAWSEAARAVYVAHEGDGQLVAVDGERHQVVARIDAEPGLGQVGAAPGGRLIMAVNPATDSLHIVDTSSNRLVQSGRMDAAPDQIAFSDNLAYVRHRDSEQVLMVPLAEVGRAGQPVPVIDFPGGEQPPGTSGAFSLAASIVQAPGASAVLVANPADGMVYYYKEGMAAPMGAFKNYGRKNAAVMVVDNSLEERRPGVYETTARLRRPGRYDLAFFLDTPRTVHCFPLVVEADPRREQLRGELPVTVRLATGGGTVEVKAGEEIRLTVEVKRPMRGEPHSGLEDLVVMAMLAPGRWHARRPARHLGDDRYEVVFRPPLAGVYYLYAESAAENLAIGESRPLGYVVATEAAPAGTDELGGPDPGGLR